MWIGEVDWLVCRSFEIWVMGSGIGIGILVCCIEGGVWVLCCGAVLCCILRGDYETSMCTYALGNCGILVTFMKYNE